MLILKFRIFQKREIRGFRYQFIQVGNGIELDTVGRQFETYRWRPCGVTWIPGTLFSNSSGNKAAANLSLLIIMIKIIKAAQK